MKHHHVPQFLQRPWTNPSDNKLEVFRLDLHEVKSKRHAPKATGYEDDLYALSEPIVAGMEKQAVEERVLSQIDSRAATALQVLEQEGLRALTPENRSDWVRFIASLHLRQPERIAKLLRESADHLRDTLLSQPEQYEALRGDEDAPALDEWVEQHFPGLIDNFGLSYFHELVDNETIGNRLDRMKWWLWDFTGAKHELLLADRPCIITGPIDDPDMMVALPISPRKAFFATQSEKTSKVLRQQDRDTLAMHLNKSSVMQARKRIYARTSSPRRFIENQIRRRNG